MAESARIDEVLKRLFDANLRWYEGVGRVSADYVQALSRVWTDAATSLLRPRGAAGAAATAAPVPRAAALVLEAERGQVAQGVLMIENQLTRAVSATVVTSAFTSESGVQVWPTLSVHPGTITLEPGARTLVQVSALVDERLEPGVSYRGDVSVPGLSDRPIPIVLRRREAPADVSGSASGADETPAPADASGDGDRAPAKRTRRRKAAGRRRAQTG